MEKHEIVFDDLHGTPDMGTVRVDVDAEDSAKGITRVADEDKPQDRGRVEGDEIDGDDENIKFDDAKNAAEDDAENVQSALDEDGEDDGQYGKRVRARIERERRLRKKDQEQADYWRGQAEASQNQLRELKRSANKDTIEALESQIKQTETELEGVIEEGKSGDQVKVMSRLTDLKAKKILAETAATFPDVDEAAPDGGRVRPSGGPPTLAKQWVDRQSDWYGKPGFERQSRIANRLDKEIFAEGYRVDDPQYFKELNRRLKKAAPEVFDDIGAAPRERTRSPVAAVDGAGPNSRTRSSKVELGEEDFANMRRFGLDPNNKDVLMEYARNKRETAQQDSERKGGRS